MANVVYVVNPRDAGIIDRFLAGKERLLAWDQNRLRRNVEVYTILAPCETHRLVALPRLDTQNGNVPILKPRDRTVEDRIRPRDHGRGDDGIARVPCDYIYHRMPSLPNLPCPMPYHAWQFANQTCTAPLCRLSPETRTNSTYYALIPTQARPRLPRRWPTLKAGMDNQRIAIRVSYLLPCFPTNSK